MIETATYVKLMCKMLNKRRLKANNSQEGINETKKCRHGVPLMSPKGAFHKGVSTVTAVTLCFPSARLQ